MLKIMFLNAWGGCLSENLFPYVENQAASVDAFCFTEVFRCFADGVPAFQNPKDRGHRQLPLNVRLFDALQERLARTHDGYFASQMYRHFHDLEPTDLPVQYGIAMFLRKTLPVIDFRSGMLIRGYSERNDGKPASRAIQSACIWNEKQTYVIAHFHGVWTEGGKGDTPERVRQSYAVIQHIVGQCAGQKRFTGEQPKVILGGDFNLRSDNSSFGMLLNGSMFGPEGGINLNNEYGIRDTRTTHYPAHKPTREADFVLVSRDVEVCDYSVPAEPVVSDHRPIILACS